MPDAMDLDAVMRQLQQQSGGVDPGFYAERPPPTLGGRPLPPPVSMPQPAAPWGDKNLDPNFYKAMPQIDQDDRTIAEQMLKQIGPPVYSPGRAAMGPSEMMDRLNAMGRLGQPR